MSIETMERTMKLIKEGNPQWRAVKDFGCSQSSVSKIWCKYQRNGMVKKGKRMDRQLYHSQIYV